MELEKRVDIGIKFLEVQESSILRNVQLELLRMESPYDCLLGQYYGCFTDGQDALRLTDKAIISYGLDIWIDEAYSVADLTPIWQTKIRAWRQAQEGVQ